MKVSKVRYDNGITVEALQYMLARLDPETKIWFSDNESLVIGRLVIHQDGAAGNSATRNAKPYGRFVTFFGED